MQTTNEERRVEIGRIESLEKGDKFLYNGSWREVRRVQGGRLYYVSSDKNQKWTPENISSKSKLFVEIERKIVD